MPLTKSILYAVLLATASHAAPTLNEERGLLQARVADVTCNNQAWKYVPSLARTENKISGSQITSTLTSAPATAKNGDKNWGSGYPHEFQNFGGLISFDAACDGKTMLEFPLYKSGKYDADKNKGSQRKPEGFRIIYTETDKTLCGVISHDGTAGDPPVEAKKASGKQKKVDAKPGTVGQTSTGNFHKCT